MSFSVGGPPQGPKLMGLQLPVDHELQETPYTSLTGFAHPWALEPHHPWDLSTIALHSSGISNRIYGTKLFLNEIGSTNSGIFASRCYLRVLMFYIRY